MQLVFIPKKAHGGLGTKYLSVAAESPIHAKHNCDSLKIETPKISPQNHSENTFAFSSRYPPYTDKKLKVLSLMMAKRPDIPGIKYLPHLIMFGLGVAVTLGIKALIKVQKSGTR